MMNGDYFPSLSLCAGRGLGSWEFQGPGSSLLRLSMLYDLYEELAVAAAIISLVLSLGLYVASHRKGAALAEAGGAIGRSCVYDFFMGRELNPRLGPIDLKFFCELRPGLLGWAVLNLGMLCKQREILGYVSFPMMMVNICQGLYVWDALYHEQAILTTMDITTDGFGFMLAFGDLCWVPFIYSLQARYLVNHDPGLPKTAIVAIGFLNMIGYAIFRFVSRLSQAIFRYQPSKRLFRGLSVLRVGSSWLLVSLPNPLGLTQVCIRRSIWDTPHPRFILDAQLLQV